MTLTSFLSSVWQWSFSRQESGHLEDDGGLTTTGLGGGWKGEKILGSCHVASIKSVL